MVDIYVKIAEVFGNMVLGNGKIIYYIAVERKSRVQMIGFHFIVAIATIRDKFVMVVEKCVTLA